MEIKRDKKLVTILEREHELIFSFELPFAWSSNLDGSVSLSLSWYELKPESTSAHWLLHNALLYYITKGCNRHCLFINYSVEQMITKIWEETPSAAESTYYRHTWNMLKQEEKYKGIIYLENRNPQNHL